MQMAASPRMRLRSTTGCKICRRRHVKCDEVKPRCLNCGKKNRPCRYDDSPGEQTPPPRAAHHNGETPSDNVNTNRSDFHDSTSWQDLPREATPLEHPPPSASTAISPFSATLESILLQTGIDSGVERPQDYEANQEQSRDINVPAYIDPYPCVLDVTQSTPRVSQANRLQLSDSEVGIFRNYVEIVSKWVDSFSHDQPFHRLVPVLALKCAFLLHSCLALSSKQMMLIGVTMPESTALRYYRLALKAISNLLVHHQYAHSDELLASCIILSTYEMIDVVGEGLGSHLTGIASLLQTRQINGNMFGIRGACYWTWYRQEIWASLQTGRPMSLDERYWRPPTLDTFDGLTIETIANRVIFIFGQCINFCNDNEQHMLSRDELLQRRNDRAAELEVALDVWKSNLPPSMSSFPTSCSEQDDQPMLSSIWFIYPQSAIAHQVYNASKIILYLYRPPMTPEGRGLESLASLSLRRSIETSREQIFLTANAGIPSAWSLVSAQCLYIAGLVTEGIYERKRTLGLIDECQRHSGRRTSFIADELRKLWGYNKPMSGISG